MPPSAAFTIRAAIVYELLRKHLVALGRQHEARRTYDRQRYFLPDHNTGRFWDDQFHDHAPVSPMEAWRIKTVVQLLDLNQSILNLGVGRGELERALLNKGQLRAYLGTDITDKTLARLHRHYPSLTFQKAGLTDLDPARQQFQQILLLEVLEHIRPNQTFAILEHVRRLLAPGGRFFLSVPVNEGLEYMLPHNPNSHQRLYSEDLVKFELETAGFGVEKVYRASAFDRWFSLKHAINKRVMVRQANNLIFVCRTVK